MTNLTLHAQNTSHAAALLVALDVGGSHWKVAFGDGSRTRVVSIPARDFPVLVAQLNLAKERFGLSKETGVCCVHEAGRDGFWIDRVLRAKGYQSMVIDAAGIEVNRRQRRAKNDRLDAERLLQLLRRYLGGEKQALSVVRVPSAEEEDVRRPHREMERLRHERQAHQSRIGALLATQGVVLRVTSTFAQSLVEYREQLGAHLYAEITREHERYLLVHAQYRELERLLHRTIHDGPSLPAQQKMQQLIQLRGIGPKAAHVLVREVFGWRKFDNRRQLAASIGLCPTPHDSGGTSRELGISKAGNRRVRTLANQLSWLWLRHQPDSKLSRWFYERFSDRKSVV